MPIDHMDYSRVTPEENLPNVNRVEVPSDPLNDSTAWIYVPSKNTIYIGPPGTHSPDLVDAITRVIPEKDRNGVVLGMLDDDGYADLFSPLSDEETERLLDAVKNYYLTSHKHQLEKRQDEVHGTHWDYLDDDEDSDHPDSLVSLGDGLVLDEDTGEIHDTNKGSVTSDPDSWYTSYTPSLRMPTEDPMHGKKLPQGINKQLHEWTDEDYQGWKEKFDTRGNWGYSSPREDHPHFRWSYGDSNLVSGAPHEGLWMWPVRGGYPDHFSQTGWEGQDRCAQGRVYPHVGGRWEVLTWPNRPRGIKDNLVKDAIQAEAQQAAKQWVMETLNVPEDKIYFTKGYYGDMVINWDSPSYRDYVPEKSLTSVTPAPLTPIQQRLQEMEQRNPSQRSPWQEADPNEYDHPADREFAQKVREYNERLKNMGQVAVDAMQSAKRLFNLDPDPASEQGQKLTPLDGGKRIKVQPPAPDAPTIILTPQEYQKLRGEFGETWWQHVDPTNRDITVIK